MAESKPLGGSIPVKHLAQSTGESVEISANEAVSILVGRAEGDVAAGEGVEQIIRARFFTAASGEPPTDKQRAHVDTINELVVRLGVAIEALVPHSRNKSLALTALEDVSMRANRAIFATGPSA